MRNRDRLLQEEYINTVHGPWKILVVCSCLNVVAWPIAEVVLQDVFERYQDPWDMDEVNIPENIDQAQDNELYQIVKCLGFGMQRTERLIRMSRSYTYCLKQYGVEFHRYKVKDFRGCGVYACDAWKLFVLKEPCSPKDRYLLRYAESTDLLLKKNRRREKGKRNGCD